MSYVYSEVKPWLFTDEGSREFIKLRDKINAVLEEYGAFRMSYALRLGAMRAVDTDQVQACVDRMVELGEIVKMERPKPVMEWAQYYVYTRPESHNR